MLASSRLLSQVSSSTIAIDVAATSLVEPDGRYALRREQRLPGVLGKDGALLTDLTPADIALGYKQLLVISGFEPLDVLQSILWILRQLAAGECRAAGGGSAPRRMPSRPAAMFEAR